MQKLNPFGFASSLWSHRELFWQFTLRNIELRHRGSHLGLLWAIFNPLLLLALYVFVFGYVFKGSFHTTLAESRLDYSLTVFLGLTIFQLFAEVLGVAPMAVLSAPNLVKKVVFPVEILPASGVAASVFHMLISMTLVLLGVAVFGAGLTAKVLWLPAVLIPLIMLVLGMGWLLAAIGVFVRDFNQVIALISMSLMFASAVFYPVTAIPAAAWSFLRFNPLLQAIELAREVVVWNTSPDITMIGYITICGLASCTVGYWCFQKMSSAFADVL